jgi:hypothetical protein
VLADPLGQGAVLAHEREQHLEGTADPGRHRADERRIVGLMARAELVRVVERVERFLHHVAAKQRADRGRR